jgi:hypothetical protein
MQIVVDLPGAIAETTTESGEALNETSVAPSCACEVLRSSMRLSTLVEFLEREAPGIGESASTRINLARLYAERGCHDDAAAELRVARRKARQRGDASASAIGEVSAAIALAAAPARSDAR